MCASVFFDLAHLSAVSFEKRMTDTSQATKHLKDISADDPPVIGVLEKMSTVKQILWR